jgi:hypothetical protein
MKKTAQEARSRSVEGEGALPNALVVGPQRAGTTWIYRYLQTRDRVCVSHKVKETFFFDHSYERGPQWYAAHFAPTADQSLVVEVGPTYFHSEEAPRRVLDTLGRVPIVVSLRNPVERLLSLYLHFVRYGKISCSLREALQEHDILVASSRYATHLKRWREVFGRSHVSTIFQEALSEGPEAFARQACEGLGLPFEAVPASLHEKVNSRRMPYSRRLARVGVGVAEWLRDVGMYRVIDVAKQLGLKKLFLGGRKAPSLQKEELRPVKPLLMEEVEALEALLGRSFGEWKDDIEQV